MLLTELGNIVVFKDHSKHRLLASSSALVHKPRTAIARSLPALPCLKDFELLVEFFM